MTNLISDDFINETVKDFVKTYRKEALLPTCIATLPSSLAERDVLGRYSRFLNNNTAVDISVRNLSDFLKKTNNSSEIQDMPAYSIQTGAELFLQMNLCPPSAVLKKWKSFLEYLFSESLSPQQKVLALFKIIQDKKSKDDQQIANTIMARLSRDLGFQYLVPKISNKGLISQVKWKANIGSIPGKAEIICLLM